MAAPPNPASTPTLFMRQSDGVVCIYTGSSNVVTNPTADLSRVFFHNQLNYPTITSVVTGSVSLPSIAADTGHRTSYATPVQTTLFAHGVSGVPLIFGNWTGAVEGLPSFTEWLPNGASASGSVPIQMDDYGFARWLNLGVDATNVYVYDRRMAYAGAGKAAVTLSYEVFITDITVA